MQKSFMQCPRNLTNRTTPRFSSREKNIGLHSRPRYRTVLLRHVGEKWPRGSSLLFMEPILIIQQQSPKNRLADSPHDLAGCSRTTSRGRARNIVLAHHLPFTSYRAKMQARTRLVDPDGHFSGAWIADELTSYHLEEAHVWA